MNTTYLIGDLLTSPTTNERLLVLKTFTDNSPAAQANAVLTIATDGITDCGPIEGDWTLDCNTGLLYTFDNIPQVNRDFKAGLFTRYFWMTQEEY